jgi:hypothetical protein
MEHDARPTSLKHVSQFVHSSLLTYPFPHRGEGGERKPRFWSTHWSVAIAWMLAGLLAWAAAPVSLTYPAQESPPLLPDAPPATAAPDAAPVPPPPAQTDPVTPQNPMLDLSGLAMQPVFLAVKIPVAVVGAIAGGLVWAANGGSTEQAQTVWGPTMGGTWGWPEFVRSFSKPAPETP